MVAEQASTVQATRRPLVHVSYPTGASVPVNRPFVLRDMGTGDASGDRYGAVSLTASRPPSAPSGETGWHYHVCREHVFFMVKGWTDLLLEDGRKVRVEEGSLASLRPGTLHNDVGASSELVVLELTVCDPENLPPLGSGMSPSRIGSVFAEAGLGGGGLYASSPSDQSFQPAAHAGYERQDLGLERAGGRGSAELLRAAPAGGATAAPAPLFGRSGDRVVYVLRGAADLRAPGEPPSRIGADCCVTLLDGGEVRLSSPSEDFLALQVNWGVEN